MTDLNKIAKSLEVGDLSNNINWGYIQDIGKFISPVDNRYGNKTISIFRNGRKRSKVKVVELEISNPIYIEWIRCCCESMWQTKSKIFYDINGEPYFVGRDISDMEVTYER